MSIASRIKSKIKIDDKGCWVWQAACIKAGYGVLRVDGVLKLAHRLSYVEFIGPIPDGLVIDHLCRVRECCNPDHLEAVTPRMNIDRGSLSLDFIGMCMKKKHAIRTDADLRWQTVRGKRQRLCAECVRERERDYYHANKKAEGFTEHGYRSYKQGCRCEICTEANRQRLRDWREKKREGNDRAEASEF